MYVAVEDEGFVAAFRQSWRLVRPEFLRVFVLVAALGLGVTLVGAAVGAVVAGVAATAVGTGWAGVVSGVLTAPLALFALAVLSAAFAQLRGRTRPDSPLAADGYARHPDPSRRRRDRAFSRATVGRPSRSIRSARSMARRSSAGERWSTAGLPSTWSYHTSAKTPSRTTRAKQWSSRIGQSPAHRAAAGSAPFTSLLYSARSASTSSPSSVC